jgi:hypothetical protein
LSEESGTDSRFLVGLEIILTETQYDRRFAYSGFTCDSESVENRDWSAGGFNALGQLGIGPDLLILISAIGVQCNLNCTGDVATKRDRGGDETR